MTYYSRLRCTRKRRKREDIIFSMFPRMFKSELFLDYSNKIMDYLGNCEKNPLAQSIDNVLPGVEQCFKNQKDIIYENGKSV